jgi:hypothetical protein
MTDTPNDPSQPPGAPPPPPPPAAFSPPAPGGARATTTNGFAIASLVLGIAQIFLCVIGGILALVFGYIARNQIDQSGGTQGGRGMAVAGIVLGWIGVGLAIAYGIAVGVLAATGN